MDTTWQVPGYVLGRETARDELGVVVPGVSIARGESVLLRIVTGPDRPEPDELDRMTGIELAHLVTLIDVLPAVDTDGLGATPRTASGWDIAGRSGVATALVYEDRDGMPLSEIVAEADGLSLGEAVGVFEPIARTLARLHEAGLRHGFVRTVSIVVDADGVPWLTGVGASQAAGWIGALHDDVAELARLVTETSGLRVEPSALADATALATYLAAAGEPQRVRRGDARVVPFDLAGRMRAAAREPLPGESAEPSAGTRRRPVGRRNVGGGRGPGQPSERGSRLRERWVRARPGVARRGRRGVHHGRRAASPVRSIPLPGRALAGSAAAVALLLGLIFTITLIRPDSTPSSTRETTSNLPTPASASHPEISATEPGPGQVNTQQPAMEGVLGDPAAPQTDPLALVQALADLRARAWTTLDLGLLTELNAADSAALSADRVVVRRALSEGLRYRDLEFTVTSADTRTDAPRAGTVLIDAVIDTSPYAVVPAGAAQAPVPAVTGRPVTLTLAWSGWRWQVADVASAPTGSTG